ncbi:uncharacterized protein MELLADRAFT_60696 [Melampsora larici-populina 98AG31]|uniref:Uncharacterized protein n=1 Tax=Melampsora larici-populina (strain 98AG31 / pathotype 3-4-7) TaxID=747676 RepID=F4RC01_MELLP|nr:uncharacterized protein MELLADRAFT_60696 [Melampsora larici-populina 98AG31]EGG10190.1 hypothetical protein MELLADRAFT_60696 [Melampsora larici-populina 98AG31]
MVALFDVTSLLQHFFAVPLVIHPSTSKILLPTPKDVIPALTSVSDLDYLDWNSHSFLQEDQKFMSLTIKTQFQINSIQQKHEELADVIADVPGHFKSHPKTNAMAIKESERLGLIRKSNNIQLKLRLPNPDSFTMQDSSDTVASYWCH